MNVIPLSKKRQRIFNVFKGMHTNLFAHECYKAMIGSKILFVLFGIIVVRAVSTGSITVYIHYHEVSRTTCTKECR